MHIHWKWNHSSPGPVEYQSRSLIPGTIQYQKILCDDARSVLTQMIPWWLRAQSTRCLRVRSRTFVWGRVGLLRWRPASLSRGSWCGRACGSAGGGRCSRGCEGSGPAGSASLFGTPRGNPCSLKIRSILLSVLGIWNCSTQLSSPFLPGGAAWAALATENYWYILRPIGRVEGSMR